VKIDYYHHHQIHFKQLIQKFFFYEIFSSKVFANVAWPDFNDIPVSEDDNFYSTFNNLV